LDQIDEPFLVEYNFTDSDSIYKYEVRTLNVSGVVEQCVYDEDVGSGDCTEHNASFTTRCPLGSSTDEVNYTVGCYASAEINEGRCRMYPDSWKLCTVTCGYCTTNVNLVFNVSSPSIAECTLHLWYNTTAGEWCRLTPKNLGDYDTRCVGSYGDIKVDGNMLGDISKITRSVTPNLLETFRLTEVRAPTKYRWNVFCGTTWGGEAHAIEDWIFTARCPKPELPPPPPG
jgi:hypothetical protein